MCSPNTVNEWGWAVTPRSIRTLLAIASVDIAVGIAAYTCRGTVGICDSLRWASQRLLNSRAVVAGPCSGMLLGRTRKLEQANASICSVYVTLNKLG